MLMSTVILYGTETGTGELVSDSIADILAAEHDPSIYDMTDFAVGDLNPSDFVIVVCSTYGEGEIMAEMLTNLGATQVGEHGRHDLSSDIKPTTQAEEWAQTIAPLING